MDYKGISQLRNTYPEERNVQLSYENKNNSINYKGRYSENSLNFTIEDLSGVSVVDGTSFNFILEIDGSEYTSPSFKSFLENSLKSGNPYIQKSNVTRITLSSQELLNIENFGTREKYAEVDITKNLKSITDIIQHIDWLVSKTQTLRNIGDYGQYSLYTTEYDVSSDTGIGLEYSDAVQRGEEYVASNETITEQKVETLSSNKTLLTEVTTTTPERGTYTTQVKIPIRYDISNPFTAGGTNFVDYYNIGFSNYGNR